MNADGTGAIFAPTETDSLYLHQSGISIYNADKRVRRDNCFTVTYVLLAALTFFWGIAAFVHSDKDADLYTMNFYAHSGSCDIQTFEANKPAQQDDVLSTDATFVNAFNKAVAVFLPISACVAVALSVAFLVLFRRFAKFMVKFMIGFSLAMTFILGLACLFVGAILMGILLIISSVASAVFYYYIRKKLDLCAELMALSARGLYENGALIPAAIGIKVCGAIVLLYGFAAFINAVQIGHVEKVLDVARYGDHPEWQTCTDVNGYPVDCCAFRTQGWAAAYCCFCAIFVSWTTVLILEIKLYTVANTLAQWYFSASAPGSNASLGFSGSSNLTPGSVRLALRHCLTTSFGSVAFASAIITIIKFIQRVLREQARRNIICCIINCIVQPILALLEKFTQFATIAAAITGQAFVPAARTVFETLKRNFLQTYTMWWVPESVLGITVFLMSLSWGGVVLGGTYGMTKGKGGATTWGVPVLVGLLSAIMMAYLLKFVSGLLLDAVNTLYICYAMDKDQRRVTLPEVHNLFAQIPGLAVENPDGNIVYGAPDQAAQIPVYHHQYQYPPEQQPPTYPVVYPVQVAYPPMHGYPNPPTHGYANQLEPKV